MTHREWAEEFVANLPELINLLTEKMDDVEGAAVEAMREACSMDACQRCKHALHIDDICNCGCNWKPLPDSSAWLAEHDRRVRLEEAEWWTGFIEKYRNKLPNSLLDFGELSARLAALRKESQP